MDSSVCAGFLELHRRLDEQEVGRFAYEMLFPWVERDVLELLFKRLPHGEFLVV